MTLVQLVFSQSWSLQGLIVGDIMLLELWTFVSRLGLMQYRDHLFQLLPVKKRKRSVMSGGRSAAQKVCHWQEGRMPLCFVQSWMWASKAKSKC